jgi:hypothetical protein
MVTPALPLLAVGTNGDVAFGQTQLMGDITDWYAEQLVPGADGLPAAAMFNGAEVPLVRFDETFHRSPRSRSWGSEGGSQTITRFTTADGRWITSVEGREVSGPDDVAEGETAINLLGDWVVPEDQDGDGLLSAISFDYAGLDLSNMPGAIDRYTRATDVAQFAEATRDLVAYSLNLVAGDKNGGRVVLGVPGRPVPAYLDRGPDGAWIDGADPEPAARRHPLRRVHHPDRRRAGRHEPGRRSLPLRDRLGRVPAQPRTPSRASSSARTTTPAALPSTAA